ncbi:psbV, partial [Symbiodinium necroappetens]
MALRAVLLCSALGLLGLRGAFVAPRGAAKESAWEREEPTRSAEFTELEASTFEAPSASSSLDGLLRFAAGALLGLAMVGISGAPAKADVEDVVIPVDDKGKTTTLTKEQLVRGKRLFNAACASCHVGGGTRTNQNVGLAIEELSGAQPNRASVEGLVDYLNNPTTYDGLKDISEVHPSIKGGDIWPKMRSMKQQDLYDMSAYILYQNQTIPEKSFGSASRNSVAVGRCQRPPHWLRDCCEEVPPAPKRRPLQARALWTPGSGYRPRGDDPHRRPTLQLREGAEAKVRRGYPWLPSKAVRNPEALQAFTPCLVNVEATDGDVLGVALYSGLGSIAARMLCTTAYVRIDAAFFAARLQKCLAYRERLFPEPFYRLVHGEADGLPGLMIDRYADHVVIAPAAGMDLVLWPLVDALEEVLKPKVVIIRQDTLGRRREGAALRREVLSGRYVGPTELRENGVSFAVDLLSGQKTGWYYDQRDHRTLLASLVANTPRVLDLYSYVGGFGVTLAHYGAESVVCVDSSEAALELCRRSAAMNSVSPR